MALPHQLDAILALVDEIGAQLTDLAPAVDNRQSDSSESYRLVKESGLLGLLIPRQAGGAGLNYQEYSQVLARLAQYDAATALGFNMHNVALGSLCESADKPMPPAAEAFRAWVFDEVIQRNMMFASATSETGSGARLRGIQTHYRPHEDGFLLNGTKSFVSLAGAADYIVVTARPEGSDSDSEVTHFVVGRHDEGVQLGQVWDGFAMNGTQTASMTFENVWLPRQRLFLAVEGMSLFKLVREPHWMISGYTGVYLGIASALLAHITEAVRNTPSQCESSAILQEVGKLSAELQAGRALLNEAGGAISQRRGTIDANAAVHAAKYFIGELAPRMAMAAVRICGAGTLNRSRPLERLLRESFFCNVMPAKPLDCLEYLGKAQLGVNLFDARQMNW
ncbi:acyl-CoA dehydrogenase family protein [Chromobacterium alticapitis]|uniref:Acyl-CoA dehydrogenase n=1 Tax=Chromobacterium alticapitis TaxID=2073169 RepID=A0A2S5DFV8_9NEIS|nr:acyl-CoA dehydrogenase family protein [Chromobacterium alticapitis]POZ61993.1 acyl-CoA dehydrogenase [Chromobacterium alticapitis]